MYYVKIPLRFLGKPDRLKVDDEVKQQLWEQRVADVLADLARGVVPSWAVDHKDIQTLKVEKTPH